MQVLKGADGHNTVGVHLAGFVDRDIFAGHEMFIREMKSDLVGPYVGVVVERPATTGAVNKMAPAIRLIGAQSGDPAGFAMRSPQFRVDLALRIERCDDYIGDGGVAFGVTGFARELDADLPELRRQ